ncbi:MAG: hypothetical protein QOF38_3324 [Pseudonocardiales bacterium]|nr:hypothetical protein [Pseudonocardiales bacterium]
MQPSADDIRNSPAGPAETTCANYVVSDTKCHGRQLPAPPLRRRRLGRPFPGFAIAAALLLAVSVVAGCSGGDSSASSAAPSATHIPIPHETAGLAATAADGRGAIRPLPALAGCTATVSDPVAVRDALSKVSPGDRVCITGDLGSYRLKIIYSGTEQAPIHVVGDGNTRVNGIEINAANVIVDGFTVLNARSPEVEIEGNNVKILHNTFGHDAGDTAAQPNCMETFSTDLGSTPSHHVLIDSNRCENTTNICLQAFGPHARGGTGRGETADLTFNNNYCQTQGSVAVTLDDVQNATITNNVVERVNHAWALRNNSTGAKIAGNTIAPGTPYEVGMDDSSKVGYQGPPAGGTP